VKYVIPIIVSKPRDCDNEGNEFSAEILGMKFPYEDLSFRRSRISDSRIPKRICLRQTHRIVHVKLQTVFIVTGASDCTAEKKKKETRWK